MNDYIVSVLNVPPYRCVSPGYCGLYLKSFISSQTDSICHYFDLNAVFFRKIRESSFAMLGSSDNTQGVRNKEHILSKLWDPYVLENGIMSIERQFRNIEEIIDFAVKNENLRFLQLISSEITSIIEKSNILMFSIYSIEQLITAISISKTAKRNNSNIKILWGGCLASRFPHVFEKSRTIFSFVDIIVTGDGELTNPLYVNYCMYNNCCLYEIPGVLFCDNNGVHKTSNKFATSEDINSLNSIDFSDINTADYPAEKVLFPLMSSRECYYKGCLFCDNYASGKVSYRFRNANRIIADVKNAIDVCGAKYFRFIDDSLPINVAIAFAQILIDQNICISWGANIRCEKKLLDIEVLNLLKRSGCKLFFTGIESGSDRVLLLMNKGFLSEQAHNIIQKFHSVGIAVHASFLFGFPGEKEEDVIKTCNFIRENLDYLDIIEINYFNLTVSSKIYNEVLLCKNIIIGKPGLFSAIAPIQYIDSGRSILKYSYNAYCSMKQLTEMNNKTPSLNNITSLY